MTIAALYVAPHGVYWAQPDVDPGDAARDARRYAGPHAVVAHPPCARWGRFYAGRPGRDSKVKGDDGGCFKAALHDVRHWGGVLEHPRDSAAWEAYGLAAPPRAGGWVKADEEHGWTCCVEQGHYGHQAQKPTWLYAAHCVLPDLIWGPSVVPQRGGESKRRGVLERMSRNQRAATPEAFRDVLLAMARSVQG